MTWFRVRLSHTTPALVSKVGAIPGVSVKGTAVFCHDNAAWLVERLCHGAGVFVELEELRQDGPPLESIEELVPNGLREWVPGFLTEYQREGVLKMAHRDGHFWWAAGCLAGDTLVRARWAFGEHVMRLSTLVRRFNGDPGGVWDYYRGTYGGKHEVLSYNETTGEKVWNRLEAAVASGVKQLFRVRHEWGHVDATADHRFLTTYGWKRLEELEPEDVLFWQVPATGSIRTSAVQSIQPLGRAPTFDLCMAAPHHNFIANGIVVHNSGKTLGAICWALASPGATVMVTRAGVRRQHGREIERVTTHRALVVESKEDAKRLDDTDALFAVVGYEMLPEIVDDLLKWRPKNLVLDEVHKTRSPKRWAATTTEDGKLRFDPLENIAASAYQLSRFCERRLGTTATPIKDRTRDLWAQLDLIHPDAWGRFYSRDKASFAGRYCNAFESRFGGVDHSGSSNLEELWARVSLVTHHVPHSVTHRHLPPKRRVVTYVSRDEQVRADGFTKDFFKKAAKNGPTAVLEARLMEAAGKKRKVLLDMVDEAVAGGQKVVVFTGRREDCERLAADIDKLVEGRKVKVWMGHGGTTVRERDVKVRAFMEHVGACVFVGTGDAFGEGVNLNDADLALIAMLPYTPGAIIQWEGRFSRHGQKRPVLVQYLVAEGTVDEHVVEILLGKLKPVEDVSKEDSLAGFEDAFRGVGSEEEVVASVLAKLGV